MPIGLVTVTYSPGEHLQRFVDSLADATRSDVHVVLADNGSHDGVPEAIAAAYECVEFTPTGGNIGYGAGMNFGARILQEKRASGELHPEYFLIVNPDVVFAPGSIDALIQCARENPQAGAVGPRIVEPDGSPYPSARAVPRLSTGIGHALLGNLWPNNPWSKAYRQDGDMEHTRQAGWLSGSCILLRWDAFLGIGGFDERYFMYLEDVDLGDRMTRAGWSNVYCPDAVITHAQGHSTSAHSERMLRAHHESAYRFLADRYSQPWQAPLRILLKIGLAARAKFVTKTSAPRI
ncbi:MAG: glycosyltransferase family 2 protein [Corynebacterium sp.]|nr:glycosyltransferase family 2 protein [Corynebacterium sp.]